jgi:tetratricopeptide (TPR) repeat protein
MRRLVMMLAATSLLICAAPYGRTDPIPDAAKTDKLEGARMAEVKGDLARIHDDYARAVSYYLAALRVSPQNAALYNKLGIAELQLGERGSASKDFGKALKYDPQLISAVNNLGAVYLMQRKYKPAIGSFKRALAMDESSAPTHLNLAEAWLGLGETDRAMTEYARALELDADVLTSSQEGVVAQVITPEQHARVSYMIAKSYMKRGNIEGALDYLGRAKQEHYSDLAKVYTDPDFTALWPDPRLAKIIKR